MDGPLRVGVIGTGIGAVHVEVFAGLPDTMVTGVCSAQRSRAEALAAKHGVPFATDDYCQLLERVDAVVIATPPALHAPMGLDAIAAGKHVFCEKPLADSLAAARALRDAAQAAGVVNMLNLQLRHAPEYAHAKRLIEQGLLGRLALADARITMNPQDYLRASNWSDTKAAWFTDAGQAGGLLASSAGPHLVDLLLWLGGPIVEVAARTVVAQPSVELPDGTRAAVSSEDGFIILARFAAGGIATLRGVPVAYHGGGWTLELHGSDGSLLAADGALRAGRGDAHNTAVTDETMRAGEGGLAPVTLPAMPEMRAALAAQFVAAARAGGPSPAPSFADGVAIQAVLEASLAAARGAQWVAVPAS
jgi:predicted dehydrogenase